MHGFSSTLALSHHLLSRVHTDVTAYFNANILTFVLQLLHINIEHYFTLQLRICTGTLLESMPHIELEHCDIEIVHCTVSICTDTLRTDSQNQCRQAGRVVGSSFCWLHEPHFHLGSHFHLKSHVGLTPNVKI